MPDRSPLAPRLRELDQALGQRGMPAAARARVEARLEHEARRRAAFRGFRLRWLPALTFAAGAALVLVVVGLGLSRPSPSSPEPMASRVMGIFTVQGQGCHHHEDEGDTVLDGNCRLVAPVMAVHTWERARMRHDQGVVHLREGSAMFDVTTVEPGEAPTRIGVSHGIIEVLGTRFTIEQGPRGGHVDLFEGRIRFLGHDGSSAEIAPGQRYTWGETFAALTLTPPPTKATIGSPATPASSVSDDADSHDALQPAASDEPTQVEDPASVSDANPAPPARHDGSRRSGRKPRPTKSTTPTGSAAEAATIIDEVARLRSQGRYADAAAVLRRADRARRWDRRTAQVLSFELGDILGRHLKVEDACAHWARHQARFGQGRYARAVQEAQARLGCAAKPR